MRFLFFIIFLLCFKVNAQNLINIERPVFSIVALQETPVIDGEIINDAVWKEISPQIAYPSYAKFGLRLVSKPLYGWLIQIKCYT